jgi:hypothetical protein
MNRGCWTPTSSDSFLECCRGFEVRLLDSDIDYDGRGAVKGEHELHAWGGAVFHTLINFAVYFG